MPRPLMMLCSIINMNTPDMTHCGSFSLNLQLMSTASGSLDNLSIYWVLATQIYGGAKPFTHFKEIILLAGISIVFHSGW